MWCYGLRWARQDNEGALGDRGLAVDLRGAFFVVVDVDCSSLAELVGDAMMRVVCCVCERQYGVKPGPDVVTHGNCSDCQPRLMAGEHYRDIRVSLGMEAEPCVR